MIKIEINALTDENGNIIIPDDIKKIIPKNSIVKIIVFSLPENTEDNQ